MKKNELKNYVDEIAEKISLDIYDALCELHNDYIQEQIKVGTAGNNERIEKTRQDIVNGYIADFLEEILDYPINEPIDFEQMREHSREWADSQTDIYNYDLWRKAPIFADSIEEALEEYGFYKDRGMIGLLQSGQFYFWSSFASEVIGILEDLNN